MKNLKKVFVNCNLCNQRLNFSSRTLVSKGEQKLRKKLWWFSHNFEVMTLQSVKTASLIEGGNEGVEFYEKECRHVWEEIHQKWTKLGWWGEWKKRTKEYIFIKKSPQWKFFFENFIRNFQTDGFFCS